jgi:hypothetical protein
MTRRLPVIAVLLVGLTAVAASGTAALGAPSGGESLSLDDLRNGGQQVAGDNPPPSVRLIGEGAVLVRYQPAQPFANEQERLEPGERVETNTIQLRSSWFGDGPLDVTVNIAYWQQETRTVQTENGTRTEQVARNVTQQTVDAQFGQGYETTDIRLRPHYDSEYQVTMWLESSDGTPIEGARWRFSHRSNPGYSAASDINSEGDKWEWGFMTFVLPGVPGILVGGYSARSILQKTIVGPRKGALWWAGVSFIGMLVTGFGLFYQAAVLLAAAPWLAGLGMASIAFIVYIEAFDAEVEEAEFRQKNLRDAISPAEPAGDDRDGHEDASTLADAADYKDTVYEKIAEVDVIRRNGSLYMPKRGIRPFIARLFTTPAKVPVDDLKTKIEAEGDKDKVFEVDPESARVLRHESATLAFAPEFIHPPDTPNEDGDADGDDSDAGYVGPAPVYQRVNTTLLAVGGVGFYAIYQLFAAGLGLPGLGFVLGLLPGVVVATEARPGLADFEPAPVHFSKADATLAFARQTLKQSKTVEEAERRATKAETETWTEARRRRGEQSKTVTERLNAGALGLDGGDAPGTDPVTGEDAGLDDESGGESEVASDD